MVLFALVIETKCLATRVRARCEIHLNRELPVVGPVST